MLLELAAMSDVILAMWHRKQDVCNLSSPGGACNSVILTSFLVNRAASVSLHKRRASSEDFIVALTRLGGMCTKWYFFRFCEGSFIQKLNRLSESDAGG